jgi:endonuclease YncB( thermonuclease family)
MTTIDRIIFGLIALALSSPPPAAKGAVEVAGRVGRIVDGDTFRLGGVKIRPAGFDAPEIRQKCLDARGREYACGERAQAALAALIRGKVMVFIATGKRSYGRLVARCTV